MPLHVLIVDDHRIFRQGLRSLLAEDPSVSVVAEAENGRDAIAIVEKQPIELVIMDVAMPGLNGIDAAYRMMQINPALRIIGLSMHTDRRFVAELLRAGAMGFVSKDSAFEELEQAIRTIQSGKVYLSANASGAMVDAIRNANAAGENPRAYSTLSTREREVLQLIAEGRSTKEVALDLHLSVKTIETHRRNIMEKLEMFSLAELTKYAVREGLTTLS